MSYPGKMINISVDAKQTYQTIDGFGVNINARYWIAGLLPASIFTLSTLRT